LSIPARIELEEKVENIQGQIDYLTKGEVTIKADVEPTMIEKGSIEDKRQSRQNAQEKLNQISSDIRLES
jgi:lipid II:glycine glycyltransferase (peptidoglycan interpeptide bridge formation enzyme)